MINDKEAQHNEASPDGAAEKTRRKPTDYDPAFIDRVKELRATGVDLTGKKVAEMLGVHISTIWKWKRNYPEFNAAFPPDRGWGPEDVEKHRAAYHADVRRYMEESPALQRHAKNLPRRQKEVISALVAHHTKGGWSGLSWDEKKEAIRAAFEKTAHDADNVQDHPGVIPLNNNQFWNWRNVPVSQRPSEEEAEGKNEDDRIECSLDDVGLERGVDESDEIDGADDSSPEAFRDRVTSRSDTARGR